MIEVSWQAIIESGRVCAICDDRNVEINHVKVVLDVEQKFK